MNQDRLPAAVLLALILAYALPGIFGHDPWKPDEPYTFGVVLEMLRTGDWLVPSVGGVPFVEKPPLYYWVAAFTTRLGEGVMPLHDAARLASLIFVACTLATLAMAARLAWTQDVGAVAVLLLLGSLGLEGHAQRMQVDLALMAGFAIALLGLAGCVRERRWGGVMLGAGVAAGFLAKGLFAPAAIAATCLFLPLLFEAWRTRAYATQLGVALLVALPAILIWPALLWMRSPDLFDEWFWANNIGRFTGASTEKLGAEAPLGLWGMTLPWFLFPAWIYAATALWTERRKFWDSPPLQLGVALAAVLAAILFLSRSGRGVYALPLIVPVALIAVGAARAPPRMLDRALGFFAIALGCTAILAIWVLWLALLVHGRIPASIPLDPWLPRRFDMPLSIGGVLAAVSLTVGFAILVVFRARIAIAGLVLWVGAVALSWGLVHTLWLPWLDHARSFRGVYAQIARRLPPDAHCIVMNGVGESERALVPYFIGIAPRARFEHEEDCGALLWQGNMQHNRIWPGPGRWKLAWRGHRPGEAVEGFDLFVRPEAAIAGESWDDARKTGGR